MVRTGGYIVFDDYDRSRWPGAVRCVNESLMLDDVNDIGHVYNNEHIIQKKVQG